MMFGSAPFSSVNLSGAWGIAPKVAASYGKAKKRFFVRHENQLLAFGSHRDAVSAIRQIELHKEVKPKELISLLAVKEYAKESGKLDAYNVAYQSEQYANILRMFDDMREEEDIEYLLMAI